MTINEIIDKYGIELLPNNRAKITKQALLEIINDAENIYTLEASAEQLLNVISVALNAKAIEEGE